MNVLIRMTHHYLKNTEASMEYRIEVKNHVYGSTVVETAYLNLISLSDSIEMDKIDCE